ncbi:MAG TPA: BamA/TamA family outer membrane protein, partial [Deinococcales bacterium]|nr:BamA/TamA family outer membrane protein [Deinococcales bacterium]
PIQSIVVTGNTAVPTADILKVLRQKPGDTFNSQVASDGDFAAINLLYSERGFSIVQQPTFDYKNGVYTITVREQKLTGYQLRWNGEHRTHDEVVTRELPKPGGLLDLNAFRKGLAKLQQTGLFSSIRPNAVIPDATRPDEAILTIDLTEARTGIFSPAFGYNTLTGFEGSLTYSETNLWGWNHTASVNLQAGQNAAGQQLSGGASYTIPWLYLDFLDLKDVRTAVNLSVSSNVVGGLALAGTEPTAASPAGAVQRTFTTRTTGFGVNLSRPIGDNFTLGVSYNLQYQTNFLENVNSTTAVWAVQDPEAQPLVEAMNNYTHFVNATGEFNTRNSIDFPTTGVYLNGSVGYGFGGQSGTALSYTQETLGARTYLGLALDPSGNNLRLDPAGPVALAFRFNAGAILGVAPTSRQFALGDSGQTEDFRVRGYSLGDVRGDVFYSTSVELRYDFGLKTAVTSGLLGIGFVDVGNAWGNGSRATRTLGDGTVITIPDGPIVGYGLGLQINLGFGAFQLPAIRFDYGFSNWNPTGKFSFRLGFPF